MFYDEPNPEILVDKVLVKEYLKAKGYDCYVSKLIASFDSANDFRLSIKNIGNKFRCFVVKTNHTSGDVFFYENGKWRDKKGHKTSKRYVFACLKYMLNFNYYHLALEKVYLNIKPKIFIEEYIPSMNNLGLDEYKFFVNNGDIKLLNVVYGRQNKGKIKEAFTTPDLKVLPVNQGNEIIKQSEIKRPPCFDDMVSFCKNTVADRPLIRVDLMTDGKTFRFCEFTFYDCGGMNIFYPLEYNKIIGSYFDIGKCLLKSNKTIFKS